MNVIPSTCFPLFSLKSALQFSRAPPRCAQFPKGVFFCCCSVAKSCLTLCDSMDCSAPGSSALPWLPEFAQTHVHWVSDAVKWSHPLLSLLLRLQSFPAQRLFQWVFTLHQVAEVLELQLQHQSFQWVSGLISSRTDLLSKGLSGVFSSGTMILKHQLFGALPSWWSTSQNRAWLLEKP